MSRGQFPVRIETERLGFERLHSAAVDVDRLQSFFSRDAWQERATEHMPWFRFEGRDDIVGFVEHAERQWEAGESARYLLRSLTDDALLGTAAFTPDWEKRLAGSDVVLAPEHWGRGLGGERASAFVELSFVHYDVGAYATTCAVDNERSRRMIETVVDR
jgi:RimJ/RimL family protein N-acetyltransferase